MPFNTLKELRQAVRRDLGDLDSRKYFYSDEEINEHLNVACGLMSIDVEPFQKVGQFTTAIGVQEYDLRAAANLRVEVHEIRQVSYKQGANQFFLDPISDRLIQDGVMIQGLPTNYYTKTLASQLSPIVTGGDIQVTDVNNQNKEDDRFVIGLYPVPSEATIVTVSFFPKHYLLVNDNDTTPVPLEFRRSLCDYAVSECEHRNDNHGKAQLFRAKFDAGVLRFSLMMNKNGQTAWTRAKLADDIPANARTRRRDCPTILKAT
jgi:hypothetical protein